MTSTGISARGKNTVAVRVNNLLQPAARWYTGSGIYGHTKLIVTPKTHIPLWSTFVRTKNATAESATVDVSTAVEASGEKPSSVRFTVVSGATQVASESVSYTGTVPVATLTVPHPALWSTDSPNLYTLRVELLAGNEVLDTEDTTFGIRTMRFDPEKGFFLNEQHLKLQGMGDHLYGGPMGAAIPDGILERRLKLLKAMGLNSIRTSHNPHTPYFYELCDRLGILVMDEIYDGWHAKVKNEYAGRFYESQWHHDVERWVRRDRNHASIFAWSLGNETGLVDTNHMTDYVHSFDPTRPTTGGMMTTGVDVSGWNGPGEVPGVLGKISCCQPHRAHRAYRGAAHPADARLLSRADLVA